MCPTDKLANSERATCDEEACGEQTPLSEQTDIRTQDVTAIGCTSVVLQPDVSTFVDVQDLYDLQRVEGVNNMQPNDQEMMIDPPAVYLPEAPMRTR